MKYLSFFKSLFVFTSVVFLMSCGDNSSDTDPVDSSNLTVGHISTTAFTLSMDGQFKGLSKADIALGKHGVLYCPKTDKAEAAFKSWQDGNDNADCTMYTGGTLNGESFSGILNGLCPDTEYSFCLFSQNMDNSVRKTSVVHTFRTLQFKPDIKAVSLKEIHYTDASAELEFGMDALDAVNCEYGVMLWESTGTDASTGNLFVKYTESYDSKVSLTLNVVKPDKSYTCRPYVKYKSSAGNDDYMYGPESSFSTMTSEQMWVDLGLPSGIMWANCDLGDYRFTNNNNSAPSFMWGSLKEITYYFDPEKGTEMPNEVKYEHWSEAGGYKDIGSNISGTEYDAASRKLGGKWRMPTKTDVEELINNCSHTSEITNRTYTSYGETYTKQVRVHIIAGNDNEIKFIDHESYWCGESVDNEKSQTFLFGMDKNVEKIDYWSINRQAYCKVRPVWDPNMPD